MKDKQGFLCFRIDGERYAIRQEYLVQILQACQCYKIPCAQPWVMGLIIYDHSLCGILDYKQRMFQESTEKSLYYIIIHIGYERAGICATEVESYQDDLFTESDIHIIDIQALI